MRIWWIWVLMELGVAVQAAGFTFVPLMSHPHKLTTNVPGHQLEEIGFVPAEPGERGRASEPSWGCVLRHWNSQGGAVGFMDLPGTSSWTLGSPWKGISPPGQPRAVSCSLGSAFWTFSLLIYSGIRFAQSWLVKDDPVLKRSSSSSLEAKKEGGGGERTSCGYFGVGMGWFLGSFQPKPLQDSISYLCLGAWAEVGVSLFGITAQTQKGPAGPRLSSEKLMSSCYLCWERGSRWHSSVLLMQLAFHHPLWATWGTSGLKSSTARHLGCFLHAEMFCAAFEAEIFLRAQPWGRIFIPLTSEGKFIGNSYKSSLSSWLLSLSSISLLREPCMERWNGLGWRDLKSLPIIP